MKKIILTIVVTILALGGVWSYASISASAEENSVKKSTVTPEPVIADTEVDTSTIDDCAGSVENEEDGYYVITENDGSCMVYDEDDPEIDDLIISSEE